VHLSIDDEVVTLLRELRHERENVAEELLGSLVRLEEGETIGDAGFVVHRRESDGQQLWYHSMSDLGVWATVVEGEATVWGVL
jgi:hypothetical protein